jgi:hypothetical protein
MSILRWVRRTSEHYLMVDAMDKIGRKFDSSVPNPPRGIEIFWRRCYVPMFHLLPTGLRNALIARMPGSHRKAWQPPPKLKGPAV